MSACHAQPLPARETALARLSPAQAQAAMALARGATVTAAADALGVHRSTIYNWFKTDPTFKTAVDETWRERVERTNDEMREIEALALINVRAILQDLTAPAGVRLRAAAMILQRPKDSHNCEEWHMPDMENLNVTLERRPNLAKPPAFDALRHNSTEFTISVAQPALSLDGIRHNATPTPDVEADPHLSPSAAPQVSSGAQSPTHQ
ncbi:MAG: helix-turn-helix domain-containing protein [Bryobacteraceae bacterium]